LKFPCGSHFSLNAPDGSLIRKAGIMGVVQADGVVQPGDAIRVALPPLPHRVLVPV
jgi:hypothetical protein